MDALHPIHHTGQRDEMAWMNKNLLYGDMESGFSPMDDAAYWFGYEQAHEPLFENKTWQEARDDLRRKWEEQHQDLLWDDQVDKINEGWLAGREQ